MTLPILCLHGAIGSSAQLHRLVERLSENFPAVHAFDFTGHGGKSLPSVQFSIQLFAEDLLRWMDERQISKADIFGYSMGGYVAMYIARHYPERIGKIMTVATKLAWDIPTSQKEVKMLDPQKIAEKVPKFAAALAERHSPVKWEDVLSKTAELMLSLGKNPEMNDDDFAALEHEIQLCVGDRDTMVSIEETIRVYRLMKNARFAVLPSTPHPIEQMNVDLLADVFQRFVSNT